MRGPSSCVVNPVHSTGDGSCHIVACIGSGRGAERAVVVRPGAGHQVGNVEFLARSADTPRFNLAIITIQPNRDGPPGHVHPDADDAFCVLEGELAFTVEDEEITADAGTFVLVPPGVYHTFANRTDKVARFVNVHAPAGFDLRLEAD
jgi:mannose-6-phosphate isomerase-like protein (cupin superfamily)